MTWCLECEGETAEQSDGLHSNIGSSCLQESVVTGVQASFKNLALTSHLQRSEVLFPFLFFPPGLVLLCTIF